MEVEYRGLILKGLTVVFIPLLMYKNFKRYILMYKNTPLAFYTCRLHPSLSVSFVFLFSLYETEKIYISHSWPHVEASTV